MKESGRAEGRYLDGDQVRLGGRAEACPSYGVKMYSNRDVGGSLDQPILDSSVPNSIQAE